MTTTHIALGIVIAVATFLLSYMDAPLAKILWESETLVWMANWYIYLTIEFVFIAIVLLRYFYTYIPQALERISPRNASRLRNFSERLTVKLIETVASSLPIFGGESKQMILYIPNAEQSDKRWLSCNDKSRGFYEISQDALFRHLLTKEAVNSIDKFNKGKWSKTFDNKLFEMLCYLKNFKKNAKIKTLEIYRSSMHWLLDLYGIQHTFIVIQTHSETEGDHWWSLEKNTKYVVIQRSRNKLAVTDRLMRKVRKNVKLNNKIEVRDESTMEALLTTLFSHNIILEKYHVVKASCQTFVQFIENANSQLFVNFVNERITSSFKQAVPYTNSFVSKQTKAIINLLSKTPEWTPLFAIIYLGDPVLLENFLDKFGGDVNSGVYGTSPIQLAILFSRKEIVEILLRNPKFEDTKFSGSENSDFPWNGMSSFHTAAGFTEDTEIINSLVAHERIDKNPDELGRTHLHIAAMESNEITVGYILKRDRTNVNEHDKNGQSPFHLAAKHADINIIDLFIKAKQTQQYDKGIDELDMKKRTALHHAAMASNVTVARHLIENGAAPNRTDNFGKTPLELAAEHAKDMEIIDLFLNNDAVYKELHDLGGDKVFNCAKANPNSGLTNEIEYRLQSKDIKRKLVIPSDTNPTVKTQSQNPVKTREVNREVRKKIPLQRPAKILKKVAKKKPENKIGPL